MPRTQDPTSSSGRRPIRLRLVHACALIILAMSPALALGEEAESPPAQGGATATFAGGCFWCMEPPFDELEGVISTTSGYTGGTLPDPSYRQVTSGSTGHTEAVQITYDPAEVTYEQLLEVFWQNVDPLDAGGQFCDRGSQYRTGIFTHDETQRRLAQQSKQDLGEHLERPIVTEIADAGPFYPAEDYHQNYYQENPVRYKFYRWNCGRDARLAELWGEQATH